MYKNFAVAVLIVAGAVAFLVDDLVPGAKVDSSGPKITAENSAANLPLSSGTVQVEENDYDYNEYDSQGSFANANSSSRVLPNNGEEISDSDVISIIGEKSSPVQPSVSRKPPQSSEEALSRAIERDRMLASQN